MNKATSAPSAAKLVRTTRTGALLEVRGFGALKGRLQIAEGLDLTKPIYDQVVKEPPSARPRKS
jgi:hypothetical protein